MCSSFNEESTMIKFEYSNFGKPVNDFYVDDYVDSIIKDYKKGDAFPIYHFSSSNVFTRLRLAIVNGDISYNEVVFVFEGKDLIINQYGTINNWPNGFCDSETRDCGKILKLAIEKKKAKLPPKNYLES